MTERLYAPTIELGEDVIRYIGHLHLLLQINRLHQPDRWADNETEFMRKVKKLTDLSKSPHRLEVMRMRLDGAIEQLPPSYQRFINARFKLTHPTGQIPSEKEVAKELGTRREYVNSVVNKAMNRLRYPDFNLHL